MSNEYKIYDLTSEQLKIVDDLWALQSEEEAINYKRSIPKEKQAEVQTLAMLMALTVVEEDFLPLKKVDHKSIESLMKDVKTQ